MPPRAGQGRTLRPIASIDFRTLGTATYTASGAQSLGGLSFSTVGCDATNTIVIDGDGYRTVGGTATTYISVPMSQFPDVDWSNENTSVVFEFDDGTMSGAGKIYCYLIGDTNNRIGIERNATGVVALTRRVGTYIIPTNTAVAGTTDVAAMGLLTVNWGGQGRYGTARPTPGGFYDLPSRTRQAYAGDVPDTPATTEIWLGFVAADARGKNITRLLIYSHDQSLAA